MRRTKTKEPAPRLQKYMLGAIALAAIVVITVVYFRFFHIDMSRLNYAIGAGASESAEGNYRIAVSIYPIGDVGFMESEEIREGLKQGDIEGRQGDGSFVLTSGTPDATLVASGVIYMPRSARKKSESGIYHVMLRGINRRVIFQDGKRQAGQHLSVSRMA